MTAKTCSVKGCTSADIVTVFHWQCRKDCKDAGSGMTQYCEPHAKLKKAWEANGNLWVCSKPECTAKHAVKLLHIIDVTPYELYRDRYLETGLILDKEAMVAEVTLTEPQDWDIAAAWARVMADEPLPVLPRRDRPLPQVAAALWVLALLTIVFIITGTIK